MCRSGRLSGAASTITAGGPHDAAQQGRRALSSTRSSKPTVVGRSFERARLQLGSCRVQVGHEPREAVRLHLNELQRVGPVARTQAGIDLAQARHCRLYGGERRPRGGRARRQPMRARRQRSISSRRRARMACSLSWARSTASAAWLANVPSRLRSRSTSCTSCNTSMPMGHGDSPQAPPRLVAGPASSSSPRDRRASAGSSRRDRIDVSVRQGLARYRRDPKCRPWCTSSGVLSGTTSRRPSRGKRRTAPCPPCASAAPGARGRRSAPAIVRTDVPIPRSDAPPPPGRSAGWPRPGRRSRRRRRRRPGRSSSGASGRSACCSWEAGSRGRKDENPG